MEPEELIELIETEMAVDPREQDRAFVSNYQEDIIKLMKELIRLRLCNDDLADDNEYLKEALFDIRDIVIGTL